MRLKCLERKKRKTNSDDDVRFLSITNDAQNFKKLTLFNLYDLLFNKPYIIKRV